MAITKAKENLLIGPLATFELGGTDLGPCSEAGVTINVEDTFFDHKIDQVKATVRQTHTNRRVTISAELAEADLARMHLALGLGSSALSDSSLTIDDSSANPATLLMAGIAPEDAADTYADRTYIFDSVKVIGGTSHVMSKSGAVMLPIEMEAIYSLADSRFGIVGDA